MNGGLSIPYHSGKNGKGDSQTVVTRSTDNSIKSRNSFFTAPNTSTSSATLQQFSETSSSASKSKSKSTLDDLREVKKMLDEKIKANQPVIRKVLEPLSDNTMSLYSNRSVATKTDDVESAKLIGYHSSKPSTSKTLVTNKKLQAKQVKRKNCASSRASSTTSSSTSTMATNNTTVQKLQLRVLHWFQRQAQQLSQESFVQVAPKRNQRHHCR